MQFGQINVCVRMAELILPCDLIDPASFISRSIASSRNRLKSILLT